MKAAKSLTHEKLVDIVHFLQLLLYHDEGIPLHGAFNPDKSWDASLLPAIAEKLEEHDLAPLSLGEEPEP